MWEGGHPAEGIEGDIKGAVRALADEHVPSEGGSVWTVKSQSR